MSGEFLAYTGSHPFWSLHWLQNTLIVFLLFPTLATMYTQNPLFSAFLIRPLKRVLKRSERETVVLVHIWTGIALGVLVPLHSILWWSLLLGAEMPPHLLFFGPVSWGDLLQPAGISELVLTNWTTTILTLCFLAMMVTGPPLYTKNRPDTVLPFWRLNYAACKKASRVAFIVLVLTLDYHIFAVKRSLWTQWVLAGNAYGILAAAMAAVQIAMTVLVALMVREWLIAGIGKGRPWKVAGPPAGAGGEEVPGP